MKGLAPARLGRAVLAMTAMIAAVIAAMTAGGGGLAATARAGDKPSAVRVDYAFYNPVSLVLKDKGWLEQALKEDGIAVSWTLSAGSNKALQFLNGGTLDFGSTAGAAALLSRAGGNPIKAVYVFSRPEWTALVTLPRSGIAKVQDLKGRKIAVTKGTDPHIFLLQSLSRAGLGEKDVRLVPLQHADGKKALEAGQVDAWAGLDPFMAQAELEGGAVLFQRDRALNTYGVLNVREEFAARHPDLVRRVLAAYERARQWAIEHPAELAAILVREAGLSEAVAARQLRERTDLSNPVVGPEHRDTLRAAAGVLKDIGALDTPDPAKLVEDLLDAQYVTAVVSGIGASGGSGSK